MTNVAAAPVSVRMSRILEAALMYAKVSTPEITSTDPIKVSEPVHCHYNVLSGGSHRTRLAVARPWVDRSADSGREVLGAVRIRACRRLSSARWAGGTPPDSAFRRPAAACLCRRWNWSATRAASRRRRCRGGSRLRRRTASGQRGRRGRAPGHCLRSRSPARCRLVLTSPRGTASPRC